MTKKPCINFEKVNELIKIIKAHDTTEKSTRFISGGKTRITNGS